MNDPAEFVEGSERLTQIFGHWPSFHDAEVIEFSLCRKDVDPVSKNLGAPFLTAKIHLWKATSTLDERGYYVLEHHTLATLRFHRVEELRMDGFNHQNVIFDLKLTQEGGHGELPLIFHVEFEPCFGISTEFRCAGIEVLHAEPFDPKR